VRRPLAPTQIHLVLHQVFHIVQQRWRHLDRPLVAVALWQQANAELRIQMAAAATEAEEMAAATMGHRTPAYRRRLVDTWGVHTGSSSGTIGSRTHGVHTGTGLPHRPGQPHLSLVPMAIQHQSPFLH